RRATRWPARTSRSTPKRPGTESWATSSRAHTRNERWPAVRRWRRTATVAASEREAAAESLATYLDADARTTPPMSQYGARAPRPHRMPWSSGTFANPGMRNSAHTPATRKTAPRANDSVRTRAGDTRAWVARNGG